MHGLSLMALLSMSSRGSVDTEHPRGVWEVMGSISVRDSDFFVIPCSCHVDYFSLSLL